MTMQHLPPSNIQTDQSPYPFWALEAFIRGFGSGFVIVANEAVLAATSGEDGQHAFSLKARTEWIANTSDPGPAIPNQKIANPGGGFWVRTEYADAKWRAKVNVGPTPAWTIDFLVGDDEANGDPATPIKTHAEWARRIGNFGEWVLQGQTTLTYTSVAAMPPVTDPFPMRDAPFVPDLPGVGPIFLTIQGPPPAVKAGHGGLITAVTARTRATNQPWNVTTTGTLDASDVGLRLQITTGPRTGAVTYVDRVTGANQVDTSEWEITAFGPATFVDTHVVPSNAGADTTQVFTQGKIFVDRVAIRGGTQGALLFQDLDIDCVVPGDWIYYVAEGAGIMFTRCRHLNRIVHYTRTKEAAAGAFWGFAYHLNDFCFAGCIFDSGTNFENVINGGLCHGGVFADSGASFQYDADAMTTVGVVGAAGGAAVAVGAGSSYRGAYVGFATGVHGELRQTAGLFYGVSAMYGKGNATAGVEVSQGGGCLVYDNAAVLATITVAGPAGVDYQLAGQNLAFSFVPGAAAYQPAGGLATTWALLAAPVGGPGLGGEGLFPGSQCGIFVAGSVVFP